MHVNRLRRLCRRGSPSYCCGKILVPCLAFYLGHLCAESNSKVGVLSSSPEIPLNSCSICPSLVRGSSLMVNHSDFFGPFGGDATLYSYQSYLSPKSLVLEVGGYTGVDIVALQSLYGSFRTLLFEPVYHEEARKNLESNKNIEIFPFGLGNSNRNVSFDVQGDSTQQSNTGTPAEIKDFREVVKFLGIQKADLLQINCEGCEWEIMELLLSGSLATYFCHIHVQFHNNLEWVENKLERYAKIQDALTVTHELVYDQPWIWQLWRQKSCQGLNKYSC
ncbi:methyltransferase [Micromonas pusilla CCMP1545]|uniref:Methyltransferase n=1 Tax=Micromonas pusilla (strain CCMP1545) TaxID=564608 RepID=C1NAE3_MICPC|nr:methyltransferase [Micromonas pusilla CCMP1545]EEH50929.1 methyltransferase [Micromonas pusilla CCMP1545]|eukprot:XP_003064949.1 methyltransferase [Micromonas pusilla CCMP1545]